MARNRELLDEVVELEHRARRRDILVDEHTLFDFYDARVGEEVVSGAHFDTWWKHARHDDPELLTFDPAMLVNDTADEVTEQDYPDLWREGDLALPLTYQFEPGAADGRGDGRRTGGDAEPGRAVAVHLAGARPAAGPGRRAAPVAAQGAAGQLRAGAELRPRLPGRRVARGGVAARRPGAVPARRRPASSCPATPGTGPRCPSTCGRRSGWSARTARVVAQGKDLEALKAPLRPKFAEAMAEAASASGLDVTGADDVDLRHDRADVHPDPRRARGRAASPRWSTRARRWGCGCSARRPSRTPRTGRGLRRLLVLTLPSPAKAVADGLSNADKLGAGRLAVPAR